MTPTFIFNLLHRHTVPHTAVLVLSTIRDIVHQNDRPALHDDLSVRERFADSSFQISPHEASPSCSRMTPAVRTYSELETQAVLMPSMQQKQGRTLSYVPE